MKPLRFLHVTDVHIRSPQEQIPLFWEAVGRFGVDEDIDFIANTGDFFNTRDELVEYADLFHQTVDAGTMIAISRDERALLWEYFFGPEEIFCRYHHHPTRPAVPTYCLSSSAIGMGDDILVSANDRCLHRINRYDGRLVDKLLLDNPSLSAPVPYAGGVLVCTFAGEFLYFG